MNVSPKQLGIALLISVVLNLFFASLFIAHAIHAGHRHERDHVAFFGPWSTARGGDPAVRKAVRRMLDKHKPALHAQADRLRTTRHAVSQALSAQPFDPAALQAALAELRTQTAASQALMHASVVEVAKNLTPKQRQHFARHALRRNLDLGAARRAHRAQQE